MINGAYSWYKMIHYIKHLKYSLTFKQADTYKKNLLKKPVSYIHIGYIFLKRAGKDIKIQGVDVSAIVHYIEHIY